MTPEQIIERYDALKSARAVWETHWQELADFIIPRKDNITRTNTAGEKKGATLYDATGVQANELLAGALHGMLTNPASIFFELTTGDQEIDAQDDVRKWLQSSQLTMHQTLNNSNFQTEIHEVYLDLCSYGTSVMDVLDDDEKDVRFASRMVSEVVVEENNKGIIDTYYRSFRWTARQINQEWPDAVLPQVVQKALDGNKADTFEIIHGVYPRKEIQKEYKGTPKGYPVASCYVLRDDKVELNESGFREMPTVIPRWTKTAGEVYGRSPGMKALPEIKMLNEMKKAVIRSAQKTIDPPLMVPDDGFVLPVKTTPGGTNYYRAGSQDRIEPLNTNPRIDIGRELIQDTRNAIREAFYIDQLQLNQGPQMTATEVQQRTEEKMRLLGPMLGRQQSELLAPMVHRVFAILARKGKVKPPPPAAAKKGSYQVRYSSLIAKAQRTSEAQNLNRFVEGISPLVQLSPDVMDNIDPDKTARWLSGIYSLPQDILRDQGEIKKLRQGRIAAQQKANQMAMEQHQAEVMNKTVPAMAKAKDSGMM